MLGGNLALKSSHLPIRFISNHMCVWILVNLGRCTGTPAGKATSVCPARGPCPQAPGRAATGEVAYCQRTPW